MCTWTRTSGTLPQWRSASLTAVRRCTLHLPGDHHHTPPTDWRLPARPWTRDCTRHLPPFKTAHAFHTWALYAHKHIPAHLAARTRFLPSTITTPTPVPTVLWKTRRTAPHGGPTALGPVLADTATNGAHLRFAPLAQDIGTGRI